MKKLTLSVLSLIFLLCAAVGLVGCGKEKHTHSFTEQKVEPQYLASAATCTEAAKYYYSCSCGEKDTETFTNGAALGHSLGEWEIVKESTQTTMGLKIRKCTRSGCNYSENENIPMLHAHSFTNYVSDNNATCTQDGTKTAKCDHCDATDTIADVGSKLPHTFDKQVTTEKYLASSATCTEPAKYYYSCVCGEKGTQTFTSGNPNGHTYSEKWTYNATEHWHAATCGHTTESGRAKHNFVNNVCTVCKYDRTIAVTSVSLNKTTLMLNVDEQATLSATVLPANATDKTIIWSSSDTSVATVNNGIVTAIAKGSATITAKCGNDSVTCSVTVNNPYEDFAFTPAGNGYTLTAYSGNQTKVTVPSTYKGKPVTAIGARAFYDCSQITEIVLPNTIKEIGTYAFGYCTALTKIEIPSCTRVLDYTVSGCTVLAEITLPDGIVSLGSYLFENCNSLKKVTVFSGAVQQNTFAKSVAIEEIILGENVSSVAQRAFASCSTLKYLTMPKIDETQSFNKYYFGLTPVTYTYRGSGSDDVYPSKVDSYKYGNRVFGLPADDADWYYGGNGMNINGVYYKYDNNVPIVVSEYQSWYQSNVGVYYKMPKTWTATFYYTPDSSLLKLTITNQTVSIYGSALKDCTCEIDIKQKFPVESVELVGESEVYLDEFDIGNYAVKVKHTDGFVENFTLSEEFLQSDISELKTAGKKTLSFGYGGISGQFALTLKLHVFENAIMDDLTAVSDGTKKSLIVKGAPDGTTITYENNGQTEVGEYIVTATLKKPYYETKVLTATLYIKQETYNITYVINNTESENNNPSEYRYGNAISLTEPTSKSAVFDGWYTDKNYNYKFGGITATTYGDITLYAKFTTIFTLSGNTITGLTADGKTFTEIVIPSTVNGVEVKDIGSEAFKNCNKLTSVTIPDSVTSIGSSAFYGCSEFKNIYYASSIVSWCTISGLDNVMSNSRSLYIDGKKIEGELVIPNGITSIGSYAFFGCSGLTSVIIPNSVTSIGSHAFSGCSGLTSITIPNSVTSIGSYVFDWCSGLTSITIPDSVTSIGSYAFRGCSGLTSVTIPDSVTFIGAYAFYGCSGLESITIPDSVTSIGSSAFAYCSGLTSVIWNSENCKIAGSSDYPIFSGCGELTDVSISKKVETIPAYAFHKCNEFTNIYITDLTAWCKISGLSNLMKYGSNNKKLYLNNELITDLLISDSVVSIGDYAFAGCGWLTSITIPDSVTFIGSYAFRGCSGIESITLPFIGASKKASNGYDQVFGYIFGYFKSNSSTIPGATYQYSDGSKYYCYYIPSNLQNVSLSDNVTTVPSSAFYNCSGLTSVTILDSVTSIGSYAFRGCSGLTSVTIGNGVTSIGDYAFSGCNKLVEVINNSSLNITKGSSSNGYVSYYALNVKKGGSSDIVNQDGYLFYTHAETNYLLGYVGTDTDLVLPSNYNGSNYQIHGYAFYDYDRLTNIMIPDNVTSIGDYAFSGCIGLTSITIPDSVTSIGGYAFSDCNNLKYNEYGNALYLGNTNSPYIVLVKAKTNSISSCAINNKTKFIGDYAFYNCSGLTSITVPDSVTSIGNYAFSGCTELKNITIPDSVTSIGGGAFYGCSKLTSIGVVS